MDLVLRILSILGMSLLAYFIVVGIHEWSHIIMGQIYGFKFHLFVLGPFGLKRNEDDRIVAYIEKNPALWGGIGGAVPQKVDPGNFRAFARVLLAGPMASLVLGVTVLLVFWQLGGEFLLLLGLISLGIFAATIIPARNGPFYTDGGRWLRIMRGGKARQVEMAIFNIVQNTVVYQGYGKIHFPDIEVLMADDDARNKYLGHFFAQNYYQEKGDELLAAAHGHELELLGDKVPKSFIRTMTS